MGISGFVYLVVLENLVVLGGYEEGCGGTKVDGGEVEWKVEKEEDDWEDGAESGCTSGDELGYGVAIAER
ncbi:hypothetical protein RHGRI_004240 [Rhododendron griersonianum]|uniref:Uncharacterized protein n=1 Tax=Rhododendron griersonianum TaxID=479676 RepID=A0AAV6L8Y0_9ERIC|nr:hypothetical protein RHGRI_004240 [Rhododendron griersonianum]